MSVLTGVVSTMGFDEESFAAWADEECPPSAHVLALVEEGKTREAAFEYRIEVTAAMMGISVTQYRRTYEGHIAEARSKAGIKIVYFAARLEAPADGEPIKIGIARDVEKRIANLQSSSPEPIYLLGTVEGGADEERRLHLLFRDDHIRGEWFRMSPKLRAFIRAKARK